MSALRASDFRYAIAVLNQRIARLGRHDMPHTKASLKRVVSYLRMWTE